VVKIYMKCGEEFSSMGFTKLGNEEYEIRIKQDFGSATALCHSVLLWITLSI